MRRAEPRKDNRNRKLVDADETAARRLEELAKKVRYGGNADHKLNPGDFGIGATGFRRGAESLCESTGILHKAVAQRLLEQAFLQKMVSRQERDGWPALVWAVVGDDCVVEARLDNKGQGTYHGYPLSRADAFAEKVLKAWRESDGGPRDG